MFFIVLIKKIKNSTQKNNRYIVAIELCAQALHHYGCNDNYGEFVMLRLAAVSTLCLGLLAGCATTQNLVNKVSSSDTPLAQVLKQRPDLVKELSTVEIRQFFNSVEAPTAAQVKVTETGLMDDSVRSIRTIYSFKHMDNDWKLIETEKSYQCMRGKNTKNFQTKPCP